MEHRSFGYAISSYVPTLKSLLPRPTLPPTELKFKGLLAVRDPSLPGTSLELDTIAAQASPVGFTRLEGGDCTQELVLDAMASHSWGHFACHGSQDQSDPLESAFKLPSGSALPLSAIMQHNLGNRGLAFLSACQTATGDPKLSDEVVHLAAGMLSAGYSSVIATMWSIQDDDAPLVSGEVYERLFALKPGETPDATRSAWALHEAVTKLREGVGEKSFARWVPFIHMGR